MQVNVTHAAACMPAVMRSTSSLPNLLAQRSTIASIMAAFTASHILLYLIAMDVTSCLPVCWISASGGRLSDRNPTTRSQIQWKRNWNNGLHSYKPVGNPMTCLRDRHQEWPPTIDRTWWFNAWTFSIHLWGSGQMWHTFYIHSCWCQWCVGVSGWLPLSLAYLVSVQWEANAHVQFAHQRRPICNDWQAT